MAMWIMDKSSRFGASKRGRCVDLVQRHSLPNTTEWRKDLREQTRVIGGANETTVMPRKKDCTEEVEPPYCDAAESWRSTHN